ncbi:hypothetical protein DRG97_14805 [Escherichia coli]|nr:hypothetical protein [Escherichia coli]EEV7092068.1 hypothetical protein [Escherichia coli]EEW7006768.1 hypothetical protein [Escherichia coli]EGD6209651.1 hypothetical protein [Escherichia coli]
MIRTGITYRFKRRVTEAGAIRLFYGSFPAYGPVTGRRPRAFSLFMKIFRDPCPVSLQVNHMKNIKTCFL